MVTSQAPTAVSDRTAIVARGVTKSFGHVMALRGVDLDVPAGAITALIGDNGAGKSTLMRVLAGATAPDTGELRFWGEARRVQSITHAQQLGIELVYQDLAQAPDLSVIDNVFLGRERFKAGALGRLRVVDRKSMAESAEEALNHLGAILPSLEVPVRVLSGGQRQAVAIARALLWAKTAVLMDEPTAALGEKQTHLTNELMRSAANRDLAVLVVSHDIPNMLQVADRITVMRQGRVVTTRPARDLSIEKVVALMLGASPDAGES